MREGGRDKTRANAPEAESLGAEDGAPGFPPIPR